MIGRILVSEEIISIVEAFRREQKINDVLEC